MSKAKQEIKERPILFSGEMVRAILEGRKTQTRHPCKPRLQERLNLFGYSESKKGGISEIAFAGWNSGGGASLEQLRAHLAGELCPYGAPGNRLWVRENFYQLKSDFGRTLKIRFVDSPTPDEFSKWEHHPSIHMPRWASRITLEIVSVRVRRLQDISEEEARAEGVDKEYPQRMGIDSYITGFKNVWDSINEKRAPWESNPWVWSIEFRRVEQ